MLYVTESLGSDCVQPGDLLLGAWSIHLTECDCPRHGHQSFHEFKGDDDDDGDSDGDSDGVDEIIASML